jgi:hypothetical protein
MGALRTCETYGQLTATPRPKPPPPALPRPQSTPPRNWGAGVRLRRTDTRSGGCSRSGGGNWGSCRLRLPGQGRVGRFASTRLGSDTLNIGRYIVDIDEYALICNFRDVTKRFGPPPGEGGSIDETPRRLKRFHGPQWGRATPRGKRGAQDVPEHRVPRSLSNIPIALG